MNKTTEI